MHNIVIYGGGGYGREVLQLVQAINCVAPTWRCLGFIIDSNYPRPETLHDLPVFSALEEVPNWQAAWVTIGIGDPSARDRIAAQLGQAQLVNFPVLVHPRAWVGNRVRLDAGTVICGGAMITTDIVLHPHVHVNLCATIGHDAEIGPCTTISPGANISGRVTIRARVAIGTAASVIQDVEIGDDCVVGAGAVVLRSLPARATAVGVPARITRIRTL